MKVIAVVNQKGGVGKSTTAQNLGIGLARAGKRVLLIDADPQGNLTEVLGYNNPDEIDTTLASVMNDIIADKERNPHEGILHHSEGVDLVPSNIELSSLEVSLVNAMSREFILKMYIEPLRASYDYCLIDCMPSLGMITVNALTAADSVLIPMQASHLSVKGLTQLINTVFMVRKRLNRKLYIEGILMTMVDTRTNYAKQMLDKIREMHESVNGIHAFKTIIPKSIRVEEAGEKGMSIYTYDEKGKVAAAYEDLTKEVLANER